MPFLHNMPVLPNYNMRVLMFFFIRNPKLLSDVLETKSILIESISSATSLELRQNESVENCSPSAANMFQGLWNKQSEEYKAEYSLDRLFQIASYFADLFDQRGLQLSVSDLLSDHELNNLQGFISDLLRVKIIDSIPVTSDDDSAAAMYAYTKTEANESIQYKIAAEHSETPKIFQGTGAYLQPLFYMFRMTALNQLTLEIFEDQFNNMIENFQRDFPNDPEENSRFNYLLDDLMSHFTNSNEHDHPEIVTRILSMKSELMPQLPPNSYIISRDILTAQNEFMATLMPDDLTEINPIINPLYEQLNGLSANEFVNLPELTSLLSIVFNSRISSHREETSRKLAYYLIAIAHTYPLSQTSIYKLAHNYPTLNAYCEFLRGEQVRQAERRVALSEDLSLAINNFKASSGNERVFLLKFKAEMRDDQHRTYRQIIETLELQHKLRKSIQGPFSKGSQLQNLLDQVCQLDNRRQPLSQSILKTIKNLRIEYATENNGEKLAFLTQLTGRLNAPEDKHLSYGIIISEVEKTHPGQTRKGLRKNRMFDLVEALRKLDSNPATSSSHHSSSNNSASAAAHENHYNSGAGAGVFGRFLGATPKGDGKAPQNRK